MFFALCSTANAQVGPNTGSTASPCTAFGTASGQCAQGGVITAGGPTGSATVAPIVTYNAAGQLTAVTSATITPAIGSVTGLGTGVATALGINVGSAGSFGNAVEHLSFQPGLVTSVTNNKGAFYKVSKTSTVDNLEASASQFSCTGNPTVTMYECGTSVTCTSPTTIGAATVTTAGAVVDGTISSSAITAGDYVAFAISAGTCVTLDIQMTAQVHQN